ncbi:MAG TPA: PASTA domain-containing protein, partial [Burkholderiaceae bacterium]|nr:PASTA domain-containing protein [Burkholderiaceae bacterium]
MISTPRGAPIDVASSGRDAKTRASIALLVGASLLAGAVAAQPVPCASVAPEVRDRVREAGACRDAADDAVPGASLAPPATVTMKLSDGTVVRVPRDIGANIGVDLKDARKRATTSAPAAKSAPRARAPTQSETRSAGDSPSPQELKVPDVLGRNYADLGSTLGEFKVDQITTASAASAGVIVAQQPLPGTVVASGSTVSVQVSDGSLAAATASASAVPPITDARGSAPAVSTADPPRAPAVDSTPPAARISQPQTRGQVPILVSANS